MYHFKYLFIFLAFLFMSGCITDNDSKANLEKIDTAVTKMDSSRLQVSAVQDTAKKQGYVPPKISMDAMQKAVIYKRDSSFHVYNNIRADYRIIGYELPDTNSAKMILFSVFTSDVQDNPFQCPYGSYYDSAQGDELAIKYIGEQGSFIKAMIRGSKKPVTVYFEKKWVEFDE